MTGVDLNDTDSRRDELLAQRVGERANGSLGGAVNGTTGVGLTTSDTSNVDDITAAALVALLEDRQDGLSHVDQTGDVGVEHDAHIFDRDIGSLRNTLDEATA